MTNLNLPFVTERGFSLRYLQGDETVDSEWQLWRGQNRSPYAIQCCGRYFVATEYNEKDQSIRFGRNRLSLGEAAKDCLQWWEEMP